MKLYEKKTYGVISSVELKKPCNKIIYWSIFTAVILISVVNLFPPLWILLSGFKSTEEFLQVPPTFFPRTFELAKAGLVWEKTEFLRAYMNTVFMVAGDVVFAILLNGMAGYVLSRLKPKGHSVFLWVILWTMMMPNSVGMVPLFITFIDFPMLHINITDTFIPMWFMAGANAFYMLLFKSFFDTIPIDYFEAARMDGCSNLHMFFKIVLPLSKAVIVTVAILTVNAGWGSFLWPYLILKKNELSVVTTTLYKLKGVCTEDEYMVAVIFALIPPITIFACLQKHIMEGFNVGGIKA